MIEFFRLFSGFKISKIVQEVQMHIAVRKVQAEPQCAGPDKLLNKKFSLRTRGRRDENRNKKFEHSSYRTKTSSPSISLARANAPFCKKNIHFTM